MSSPERFLCCRHVTLALLGSWWGTGCSAPEFDSVLAYVRDGDSYQVQPRVVNQLDDARRMKGPMGQIYSGGVVSMHEEGTADYRTGANLDLRYGLDDGVAWPMDDHGLVLFSFWGHLEDTVASLEELDLAPPDLLPVDVAYVPTLPDIFLELVPAENAAYVTGGHLFILLPDLLSGGVPLAANAGVVAHETGHALVHRRTTGSLDAAPVFSDTDSVGFLYESSLHEAMADMVASLLLDDPVFIEASIDLPERAVNGTAVLSDVDLPEVWLEKETEFFDFYDPYALGTVLASFAWDVRELNDDPGATLQVAFEGLDAWAQQAEQDPTPWVVADTLVSAWPEHLDALCEQAETRLVGVELNAC
ncbi:MAG: hypothetical protein QGG40_22150, partial [Myxococcota bacterium]|nr:hypothetical protein [Myxococcota bacterium]